MGQAGRNFMLRVGGTTAVVALETSTHYIVANLGDSPACIPIIS
jgi:serine/threonine protein phosphatase PrpC